MRVYVKNAKNAKICKKRDNAHENAIAFSKVSSFRSLIVEWCFDKKKSIFALILHWSCYNWVNTNSQKIVSYSQLQS